MSDISNPLQLRADHPLDQTRYLILSELDAVLRKMECPYMVVGATARDILLTHVFGQPTVRATRDVDIAIMIDSWERFDAVKAAILEAPNFQLSTAQPYRVSYRAPTEPYATPVDIIPFGEIATEAEQFQWRSPDTDLIMNVAAFTDAYGSAATVAISPTQELKVVSIPGLLLLKLLAWIDRRDRKDVQDILRLIETYGKTIDEDRAYSVELHLLEASGFDFTLMGARLLAKDAAAIATPNTTERILTLLKDPQSMENFQTQAKSRQFQLEDDPANTPDQLVQLFLEEFRGHTV